MSDHPAGPRPPSDPRLDEVVPVQQPPAVRSEGEVAAGAEVEVEVEVEVEAGTEGAVEAAARDSAQIPLRPFTSGRDADYPRQGDGATTADAGGERAEAQAEARVEEARAATAARVTADTPPTTVDGEGETPATSDLVARVRGGVVGGDRAAAAAAASAVGEVSVPTPTPTPTPTPAAAPAPAPDPKQVALGVPAPGDGAAGQVTAAAGSARLPVTTLDVDLRPNNGSEPFRRFAILIAALFLLVGVVLFREWGSRDTAATDSSSETTSETTAEALVSVPDDDGTTGDTTDDTTETGTEGSTTTLGSDGESAVSSQGAEEDGAQEDGAAEDSSEDDSEGGTDGESESEDGAEAPSADPDATRGLLESERITLTGVVASDAEAAALVAQLESVVGDGNVDGEALTVDSLAAPLEELTLSVADELGFRPGSDTIEASFLPVLDRLIGLFESQPSVVIAVEGHTDSSGLDYENLALSQRRADAVVEYIVASGVNRFRLEPQGRGSTIPIADNSTEAGRALNRRIEFIVFGLDLASS